MFKQVQPVNGMEWGELSTFYIHLPFYICLGFSATVLYSLHSIGNNEFKLHIFSRYMDRLRCSLTGHPRMVSLLVLVVVENCQEPNEREKYIGTRPIYGQDECSRRHKILDNDPNIGFDETFFRIEKLSPIENLNSITAPRCNNRTSEKSRLHGKPIATLIMTICKQSACLHAMFDCNHSNCWHWLCFVLPKDHATIASPRLVPRGTESWPGTKSSPMSTYRSGQCLHEVCTSWCIIVLADIVIGTNKPNFGQVNTRGGQVNCVKVTSTWCCQFRLDLSMRKQCEDMLRIVTNTSTINRQHQFDQIYIF